MRIASVLVVRQSEMLNIERELTIGLQRLFGRHRVNRAEPTGGYRYDAGTCAWRAKALRRESAGA